MIEGPRDHALIDILEGLPTRKFEGRLWRVTRDGRDPTLFFAGANRWDDGTFEVLYTSLDREGALAEMYYHAARGQPIVPSRIKYRLHELAVSINGVVDLSDTKRLSALGIDMTSFGKLPYLQREGEYEMCQKIGEALHFLGSDDPANPSAILVPNARFDTQNMVIFGDYVNLEEIEHFKDHGLIDWSKI